MTSPITPQAAEKFVAEVALEEPSELFEIIESAGIADLENLLPTYGDEDQAIAIGSQIAEFSARVPAASRPAIANSLLLAQLAANKHIKVNGGGSGEWRDKYREVLETTGWLLEGAKTVVKELSGKDVEVHKAIIPVIAAALGPAVAAGAIVLSVLDGLSDMNKDSSWITLFSRESQRASATDFQIGYVDVPDGEAPRLTLVFFELNLSNRLTQVLFFKFSKADGSFAHSTVNLSINQSLFEQIGGAIEQKIAAYVTGYVRSIDI